MSSNTVCPLYDRQSLEPYISPLPHRIYDKIAYIDDRVRRLDQERASLLQRRNDIKSPMGKHLPPEILSIIFQHACHPIDLRPHTLDAEMMRMLSFRPPSKSQPQGSNTSNTDLHGQRLPIILGSVCSYWRQVAQSTSLLWTTVKLVVREGPATNHSQLLEHCLLKAKAFPCSVELSIEIISYKHPYNDYGAPRELLLRPIRDALFSSSNSSKIVILCLIAPPYEWLPIISTAFPNLEDLTLAWPNRRYRPGHGDESTLIMTKSDTPHLQRITIVNGLEIVLPCDQIVSLYLSNMTIHFCFEMLSQCQNLVECEIIESLREDKLVNLFERPVILKRLEYLRWVVTERHTVDLHNTFFQHMTLPALRTFRWSGCDKLRDPVVWGACLEFFTRLPNSMTTLGIGGEVSAANLQALLTVLPQLENLSLWRLVHFTVLSSFFEVLGSDGPTVAGTAQILPSLRVLELTGHVYEPTSIVPRLSSDLVRMLTRRFLQSKDSMLCIKLDTPALWPKNKRRDLQALVQKGFKLELRENDKLVEWL